MSDELRLNVAKAIWEANSSTDVIGGFGLCSGRVKNNYGAMADAAIAACLPDEKAFTEALINVTDASFCIGDARANGESTEVFTQLEKDAVRKVIELVYGKEDGA